MRKTSLLIIATVICLFISLPASGRRLHLNRLTVPEPDADTLSWYTGVMRPYELAIDRPDWDSLISHPAEPPAILPTGFYAEPVFDRYMFLDSLKLDTTPSDNPFAESYRWLDQLALSTLLVNTAKQNYMIQYPNLVRYNLADLPEPPKQYRAFVNPITTRIEFREQKVESKPLETDIEHRHWLRKFGASLQFSQAYVSPNWYQGGNNNLNMLAQLGYNVKLNQRFYPRYLFDMSIQYKLGLNSTPDDSIRGYNISEDMFQFNLTLGLKAHKKWYYSGSVYFKTQLFNSYPTNSRKIKSSFMSPGELNVGLGMTYNTSSKKQNFSLALSISPLSWNMKTCINNRIDETQFGIKPGRNMTNEVGSSFEANMRWKIAYNISYASRLFAFTEYSYVQADWEHTIDFAINRYLSTRFYLHMRYDTNTPRVEDSRWHKMQLKEILSFGFNYTFGMI